MAEPVTSGRGPSLAIRASRLTGWGRRDWRDVGALLAALVVLHLVAFGLLLQLASPGHLPGSTGVVGLGLGLTAYTYGVRHAFDADHIAAIDNTTRKLREDGRRPKAVGFWFAMGHASMVAGLAALVAAGVHLATALGSDSSRTGRLLGIAGTCVSGLFLYLVALLNLSSLAGIWRSIPQLRQGSLDEAALERHLAARGVLARVLGRVTQAITRPGQMFLVGLLFGLGFDTATEVSLLVMAATGAASGLPWYAVMSLPLLFAAGMALFDSLDGLLMGVAYDWAFLNPVRKVYYNLTITGLSVAVALVIGTIELVGVLHDDLGWYGPVVDAVGRVSLEDVGFVIVALFAATWLGSVAYWRLAGVERRWGHGAG